MKYSIFRKITAVLFALILAVTVFPMSVIKVEASSDPPGKDWTGYTPISYLWQLDAIRDNPHGKDYLPNDILMYYGTDVPGTSEEYTGWEPIGRGYVAVSPAIINDAGFTDALSKYGSIYAYDSKNEVYYQVDSYVSSIKEYYRLDAFYGVFDGNGYSLTNLRMDSMDNEINGLFGVNYGTIHDVRLKQVDVTGYIQVGSICSVNYGIITDCYVGSGSYTVGGGYVGGICGSNYGIIMGSMYSGRVDGGVYCGGIVGLNCGYIQKCFNYAQTTAIDYAGGIAGLAYYSNITECVSKGYTVAENGTHGAIVGKEDDDGSACNTYRNCIYSSYITSHTGEKGSASIIKNQTAFNSVGGYYFYQPSYYEGKGFDLANEISFDNSDPRPVSHPGVNCPGSSALWDGVVEDAFASGDGTKNNPYVIETAGQLSYLSKMVARGESFEGVYFELGADISYNKTTDDFWFNNAVEILPIGSIDAPFSGNFDGNGYTVKGLYCDRPEATGVGLFGCVSKGSISNVNAEVHIKGTVYVGGLCGISIESDISNCNVKGYVRGAAYVGMLCGSNYGDITGSSVSGNVYASAIVGGICGDNIGAIEKCSSSARVIGADEYQGGICGDNYGSVVNCYSSGQVWGKRYVGGICGVNNDGSLKNCYSVGKVNGWINTASVSGANKISGNYLDSGINNCYYLEGSAVNYFDKVQYGIGSSMSAGQAQDKAGVTAGKSAKLLMAESTFEGFDFGRVWYFDGDSGYLYPMLTDKVVVLGDVNGDGEVNSVDINILKRYLTDSSVEIDEYNADINDDGALNAQDTNLLKRMVTGSI